MKTINKHEYLFAAIENGCHFDSQWVIQLLSNVKYDSDKEQDWYPFKLEEQNNRYLFRTGPNEEYIEIKEFSKPLFTYNEALLITPKEAPNLKYEKIWVTVGNYLQNKWLIEAPFGKKIDYIPKMFGAGTIEDIILPRVSHTTPTNPNEYDPNKIYIHEYLKFCDGCVFITNFNNICVPALTEKAVTVSPEIKKRLAELLEKHKHELDNPVVLANINKELVNMDKAWFADDRAKGFLISGKDFANVRNKIFINYGPVKGFNKGNHVDYISKPISEGFDYKQLHVYHLDARYGSYARGAETQLGGVTVKEMLRAAANAHIAMDDCGTKSGKLTYLDEKAFKTFKGFYAIMNGHEFEINDENKARLINNEIMIRMPSSCHSEGTSFCKKCCGPYLSIHEQGLSVAVSSIGDALLYIFMAAFHGKVASTEKLNLKELIS